jgi:hypothetical protein
LGLTAALTLLIPVAANAGGPDGAPIFLIVIRSAMTTFQLVITFRIKNILLSIRSTWRVEKCKRMQQFPVTHNGINLKRNFVCLLVKHLRRRDVEKRNQIVIHPPLLPPRQQAKQVTVIQPQWRGRGCSPPPPPPTPTS